MHYEHGIKIAKVCPGSQAEKLGFLPGDLLLSVNSYKLRDPIDFLFHSSDNSLYIKVKRNGENINVQTVREEGREFGIDFEPFKVLTCKNNCMFCFVKQLPRGLRRTLYIKDDDYRMSFLYGNYVTLTNLKDEDKRRIIEQRLSPLYISVHSTNRALRNKLLGNSKTPDILKELKYFTDNKIRFHTQIVVCPGYNDKKELSKTISDLHRFYPYILSIAVVPVGLTLYQERSIRPVGEEEAKDILNVIGYFQRKFRKKHGDPFVYGADELYIKAKIPFPKLRDYRDLPQIENGVGMVPLFLNRIKNLKIPKSLPRNKRFLTFTGVSFYPFLKKFADTLFLKENLMIEVISVENTFFSPSITVAGLLTGTDVIRALLDKIGNQEMFLVPDVVLKDGENMLLDDMTLEDMEKTLGIPAKKIDSTPEGLIRGLQEVENEH